MNTVLILSKEILRVLCTDNLPHKLEKEQDLPQICNVYDAIPRECPPFGVSKKNIMGRRVFTFWRTIYSLYLSGENILPACGR